jgi:ubiquinone/menaquinone biosynthesis C-methylase UbiE
MASLGDSVERRVAFVTRLEALVGPLAGRRVLDLGCGRHALWTRAYAARGADVLAIELDPARCAEAVGRLAAAPPSAGRVLGVVRGDGERLPLPAETVAVVHCAQVLEHVGSPAAFLAEVRRVLRPGGHAYLTAINRHALRDPHFAVIGVNYLPRRVADRVLDLIGAVNPEGQRLSAMHYFSRAGFRRLCEAVGLEALVDLKREERFARHGRVAGRLADLWGSAVRSAAFHMIVRRPAADAVRARAAR